MVSWRYELLQNAKAFKTPERIHLRKLPANHITSNPLAPHCSLLHLEIILHYIPIDDITSVAQ